MLGQPYPSPVDFEFRLWHFPVRVYGLFWLVLLLLGWNNIAWIDQLPGSPGRGPLVLMWLLAVFVSILVHELGHALAFRQFGIHSAISLYHFGGFAEPIGASRIGLSHQRLTPAQDLWVAAAGPLAQLMLALVTILCTMALGYRVPMFNDLIGRVVEVDHLQRVSTTAYAMLEFILWPSVYWALFNLLPVWPLDGGRITVSLNRWFMRTDKHALVLSLIVAAFIALRSLASGDFMFGVFFGSFAVTSYQMLDGMRARW